MWYYSTTILKITVWNNRCITRADIVRRTRINNENQTTHNTKYRELQFFPHKYTSRFLKPKWMILPPLQNY